MKNKKYLIPLLIVSLCLVSVTACSNKKQETKLPDKPYSTSQVQKMSNKRIKNEVKTYLNKKIEFNKVNISITQSQMTILIYDDGNNINDMYNRDWIRSIAKLCSNIEKQYAYIFQVRIGFTSSDDFKSNDNILYWVDKSTNEAGYSTDDIL